MSVNIIISFIYCHHCFYLEFIFRQKSILFSLKHSDLLKCVIKYVNNLMNPLYFIKYLNIFV